MAMIRYEPASRKNVDRETDPYKPRKGAHDVGVCPTCHAICRNKRWHLDPKEYASLAVAGALARPCPACRRRGPARSILSSGSWRFAVERTAWSF